MYQKTYQFQPKLRDSLIEKHRKQKAKTESQLITIDKNKTQQLTKQMEQDIQQEEQEAVKQYVLQKKSTGT